MKQCSVPGCPVLSYARGWCARHYQCWRRHGDPNHPTVRARLQTTSTGHTFLGFHVVKWEPAMWGQWMRERDTQNPHVTHLAAGIAHFRTLLAEKESRKTLENP